MNNIETFWNRFLQFKGYPNTTKYLEAFHFELTEASANSLLNLVLEGKKTATCSAAIASELDGSTPPKVGDLSIITDWSGIPKCVIETKAIIILPFKDITYDICKREGEDDSLDSWRQSHIQYFIADGKNLGYEFTEDLPVLFEDFEVIYSE